MSKLFRENRRTFLFILFSNFLLSFGFRVWQAIFNNFAVEEIGVGPASIGWIQAFREIPGLFGFVLGFLALFLSEIRIMAFSVLLLGVGIFLTGQTESVSFLLSSTLLMSIGFHFFYPSNHGVILMTAKKCDTPRILGQLSSLNAIAALVATAVVYVFTDQLGYRTLLMIVGAFVTFGGLVLITQGGKKDGLPRNRRVVLRRRYWLYYSLSFLMGSRRHIFTTFAIFLLVKEHGISVQTTATLFLINSFINTYAMQAIGKLVGRFGERLILSIAFTSLIFVFLGYAFVETLPVLFVLYVFDNILFGASIALPAYFQKIALSREEITSNLSVEQTINHIAAVIIPVVGGAIWEIFGAQATFFIGVVIVVFSLILVQFMKTPANPIDEQGVLVAQT